jgi:hypothetical protein
MSLDPQEKLEALKRVGIMPRDKNEKQPNPPGYGCLDKYFPKHMSPEQKKRLQEILDRH